MNYSEIVEMTGGWGWKLHYIRTVKRADDGSFEVVLDNGVAYNSGCLRTANAGELWACNHEPKALNTDTIRSAVFIEEAKS